MIHNIVLRDESGESDRTIELKVEIRQWDIMISRGDDLLVAVEHWEKLRAHVWATGDEQNEDPIFTHNYDETT